MMASAARLLADDEGLPRCRVRHLLDAGALAATLRADARRAFTHTPKRMVPRWFYDERGMALFDAITQLPEYYLTRAETAILGRHAQQIARAARAASAAELGAGDSPKTRLLLDALVAEGLRAFSALDVSAQSVSAACQAFAARHPRLDVEGVVGDFERDVGHLPRAGARLIAFLGSTIGNLEPEARAQFFAQVRRASQVGDSFLVGTDLVKDPRRLVAAYDDAAGVTAAFNRNVLAVLNRELGADFDPERFDHVAVWNAEERWIEMRLRSRIAHTVRIRALDLETHFAAGEDLRTEVCAKFELERFGAEMVAAGFAEGGTWLDPDRDFALTLWRAA